MSIDASTPNTVVKTKRTISNLSTPEQAGDSKKNRLNSASSSVFNYTFSSMEDTEKSDVNLDDKTILPIATAVQDSIQSSLSTQWQICMIV